jgi:hypothetical protein
MDRHHRTRIAKMKRCQMSKATNGLAPQYKDG